jgi:hypothetical protein
MLAKRCIGTCILFVTLKEKRNEQAAAKPYMCSFAEGVKFETVCLVGVVFSVGCLVSQARCSS